MNNIPVGYNTDGESIGFKDPRASFLPLTKNHMLNTQHIHLPTDGDENGELHEWSTTSDIVQESLREQMIELDRAIDDDEYSLEQAYKRIQKNKDKKKQLELLILNPKF